MSSTSTDRMAPDAEQHPADDEATRAFSVSVLISGIRCSLSYVVFPWLLPLMGLASGVGPVIGLVVGAVAIASNLWSIRRFWAADHRWKWPITVLNVGVIVLVTILIGLDINELAS